MTTEEKRAFADEAERAVFRNPRTESYIEELLFNLREKPGGLVEYGIRKVACCAAQEARAAALGIDPEALRATPEEIEAEMLRRIESAARAGVPVTVVSLPREGEDS